MIKTEIEKSKDKTALEKLKAGFSLIFLNFSS